MANASIRLLVPDLDLADAPLRTAAWLVKRGQQVYAGDRLVEIVGPDVLVELPAPAGGVLAEIFVEEDQPVQAGDPLARIEKAEL
jgi:2-oxoglutarate dehydrogenase E2 component (dihydrolipoamide succinyltransferase)